VGTVRGREWKMQESTPNLGKERVDSSRRKMVLFL